MYHSAKEPFQLEANVPVPPKWGGAGRFDVLKTMAVGESFACDTNDVYTARSKAKKWGIEITTRKIAENKYRVWRM